MGDFSPTLPFSYSPTLSFPSFSHSPTLSPWADVFLVLGIARLSSELAFQPANGPYGGYITALYAAPKGTLYAATANGGVFLTRETSWK